ncbi:hypothetical protein L798_12090 [Zootermopsis nevadensis]|uniref:Uncharacterized protein n=1 Tax=Zootermopsis nevadensis TaxID=136037 RepID=A0A067R3R2_ZOONE|nr:hypothetical protein L798_12090 [Zootermopsis nevadensis]
MRPVQRRNGWRTSAGAPGTRPWRIGQVSRPREIRYCLEVDHDHFPVRGTPVPVSYMRVRHAWRIQGEIHVTAVLNSFRLTQRLRMRGVFPPSPFVLVGHNDLSSKQCRFQCDFH